MASKTVRAKAILDALADPVVLNAAMLTKVGDAYAATYMPGETLTATQKAGLFLQVTRDEVKRIIRNAIRSPAAQAAADAADADIDIGSDGI